MKEEIGLISGLLVTASVIPYAIRTYQNKIHPNLVSWSIWALLGLALLLTYHSSGATTNVWPAVFGFTNPLLITILAFWRGEKKRPNKLEVACLIIGIASIIFWWFVQDAKQLAQYALYIAIVADAAAAIPTIAYVWQTPNGDRPFAWLLFGVGYGLALFAIEEHSFANYILPVYMTVGSSFVALPLVLHRLRERVPIAQWV
ncbi:MAG: hypothetical protein HYT46_00645 [Candidatus Vogelbacteria bacterium]|nr:hypothetical protein [Candidatus Vogelbacteria bacterium]